MYEQDIGRPVVICLVWICRKLLLAFGAWDSVRDGVDYTLDCLSIGLG